MIDCNIVVYLAVKTEEEIPMGWSIQCNDTNCKAYTWATNIVDLIDNHTDENGWFICSKCGASGFIEKSFDLQEPGHTW